MTIQTEVSVQSQVLKLVPRDYEVFGGIDVDHHSISATFNVSRQDTRQESGQVNEFQSSETSFRSAAA